MNEYINIVLHSQQKNVIDLFKRFAFYGEVTGHIYRK